MDFKNTLLIAFLFIGINSFAQNILEFNRIISHSGPLNGETITLDTVPAGKTYKITSFIKSNQYVNMVINNMDWGTDVSRINEKYSFPVWLKEGDILKVYNWSNSNYSYHISGIEFNIVQ